MGYDSLPGRICANFVLRYRSSSRGNSENLLPYADADPRFERENSSFLFDRLTMPDLLIENSLSGLVAGVDEVGRGPLCGPVVAAAVIFPTPPAPDLAGRIDDSKKLSGTSRDLLFARLMESDAIIAVAAASVAEIERLNILGASLLAMRRAVERLARPPAWALIDGNKAPQLACPTRCVVGGDAISLSIAAASIIAKVVRDRGMVRLDRRWPGYGWAANAGYPTKLHLAALARLGPTPHHRMGFRPLFPFAAAPRVDFRKKPQNDG